MKKESYINYIVYTLSTYNKVNKRTILNIYKEELLRENKIVLRVRDTSQLDKIQETFIECLFHSRL